MTKLVKYTLKGVTIFFGILVLLYLIVFIYVSVNKKSIITQVTQEIGKKLNGNVSIGDVELSFFRTFPRVSVLLHNVSITDTMYAKHHHAFFNGEEVYAELSIIKLIKKQVSINGIRINKAAFYLYTDTSGYTNEYLFKPKNNTVAKNNTSHQKSELTSILLKEVRITIDDKRKEKLHDIVVINLKVKVDDDDKATSFSVKANMLVHSLAFNLSNGTFLKEKTFEGDFDFSFEKKLQQLQFDSIDIKLSGQPFNISGRFDLSGPAPQFSLRLHTRDILYPFAKSLLTAKIDTALSIVQLDKKLDADANINGPLKGGDPLILVTWKVKNTHLVTPLVDFDDASFTGFYSDEVVAGLPRRDPNSKIVINNFSASWNDLPVSSDNIEILNLYQPVLTCDLRSNFSLTKLNDIIGSNSIQLQSGDGSINIIYNGPIEKNNNTNSFINGVLSFKDGSILYVPRNVEMKNVNGLLVFKNSDVLVQNLQCVVLNNKLIMNGEAKNLLTLINTEPNKVNIDWNIYSPSLNLSSFTYLLKSRKKVSKSHSAKSKLNKLASSIDEALDEGSLKVNLKADRIAYKKFDANNFLADVLLLQDRYIINKVSMNHGGGNMILSGSLVSIKDNYHQAKVNASLENVDVKKVFAAFNNFGQNGIQSQNLEGRLNATVNATVGLDDDGKAYSNSLESVVDFSLKNGALNNFEPIKKIQSFLFKKRDFDNVHFAELKDRLEISNQEIKINRMEIESTVLSMYVEGTYSLRGNTDLSIQIPLSNLKKRGDDYKPENTGTSKKAGASLFMRGRPGPDGNIQFKPDIFNKFKKSKEKKEEQSIQ